MNSKTTSEKLIQFIENSPSAFHTVETIKFLLLKNNFSELCENKHWHITAGGNYFVTRNNSSLIAFSIPENPLAGMRIIASHSDSPTFKIKENPEMECGHHYVKLNVERYGGMIYAPWLDRPLSIAGRVIIKDKETNKLQSKLINIDRDLVLIPNLAIHMNRDINSGYQYNPQKDLLPLYGNLSAKDTFMKQIADAAEVSEQDILGHDLFLYNRQKASIWGASNEFVSAPRLDDLQCVFASVEGFLAGQKQTYMPILSVLDNEEVGSQTKQGAASTFLYDTLTRTNSCLGLSDEDYLIRLADSFMISADNAHAIHPNHQDCSDPGSSLNLTQIKNTAQTDFLLRYFVICAAQSMFLSKHLSTVPTWQEDQLSEIYLTPKLQSTQSISGCLSLPCILPTRRQEYTIPTILSKLQPNFSVEQRKKSKNIKIFQNKEGGYK